VHVTALLQKPYKKGTHRYIKSKPAPFPVSSSLSSSGQTRMATLRYAKFYFLFFLKKIRQVSETPLLYARRYADVCE
jgi:hypothetical protein